MILMRLAAAIRERTGLRLLLSLLLWAGRLDPACAEVKQEWTLWHEGTLHGVYVTQQQAEAAIRTIPGPSWGPDAYQYVNRIKSREVTGDGTVHIVYWLGSEQPRDPDWMYAGLPQGFSNFDWTTEQEAVKVLIARTNAISPECGASAAAAPLGDWYGYDVPGWPEYAENYQFRDYMVSYQSYGSDGCEPASMRSAIGRMRRMDCPVPYTRWNNKYQACVEEDITALVTTKSLECDVGGGSSGYVGNPCDAKTGDKFQQETDVDLGWVSFTRYYHSAMSLSSGGFGAGWSHAHSMRLSPATDVVGLIDGSGYQTRFLKSGAAYVSANGAGDRIVANATGWKLYRAFSALLFDANGILTERQQEDGTFLRYGYDSYGRLFTLTHSSGRTLQVNYSGSSAYSPIATLTLDGRVLATYGYDQNGAVSSVTYADGQQRIYHYEDARFPTYLTGVTTEDGQRYSTFTYDDVGRVVSSRHHDGIDGVTLAYPTAGGTVVTDALGKQTTYTLSPDGNGPRKIMAVADSAGVVEQSYYDVASDFRRRLDTVTDRKGVKTKHLYSQVLDTESNLQVDVHTTKDALGLPQERVSEERRSVDSNRLVMTRVATQEIRITRNSRLQPATVTVKDTGSGKARTTTFSYCETADVTAETCPQVGLLMKVDGPRTDVADTITYHYYTADHASCASAPDSCAWRKGDLWKTVNALGQASEVLRYDSAGRVTSIKDTNGVVTDLEYSPRGWLTASKLRGDNASTEAEDRITRIEYWPTGLVKQVTEPDGSFAAYIYDSAQRVTDVLDGLGNRVHYTLDKAGNRLKEDTTDPQGVLSRSLSRVYNTLGQLAAVKDASARATEFAYDSNGNISVSTDALKRVTSYEHDPLSRLVTTVQDVNGTSARTQVEYTELDRIAKVIDPKGLATTYAVNALGEQTGLISPDTGTSSATYDAAGNRLTETNARGITTTYRYDALGRPISRTYADTLMNVSYTYDVGPTACTADERFPIGRLATMTDRSGNTAYCYNRFGQLTRKVQTTNGRAFTVQYAYTAAGLLSKQTYPDGTVVDYTRDGQGRISAIGVTSPGGSREVLLSGAGYYPFGPSNGWTYGNGRKFQRVWDADYRPYAMRDAAAGGLNVDLTLDAVGNLTAINSAGETVPRISFTYDALDRLTQLRDGPTSTPIETYTYDATGNRLSLANAGGTLVYGYPANCHRLNSVGAEARTYDAAGNTTSIGGTAREFTYYAQPNRMNQARRNGAVVASYHYNGHGERVRRIVVAGSDAVTVYGESGQWLGDYDAASGAAIQQVIWLDELPVGIQIGPASAVARLRYIEPDHFGTPRVVIDPLRNVAVWGWDIASEAFGNSVPNEDPDLDGQKVVLDMRYPGQRYDAATGLFYNYYRDMDPATGRYVQSDPLGLEGGLSTYSYVGANPLSAVDPLGLATYLITTYDVIAGVRYGSHSATYIDGEHGEAPFLYDPSGSFGGDTRPAGGVFEGDEADLRAYVQFHRISGSEVVITRMSTTKINEKVIKDRAMSIGDPRGFSCASSTSTALAGLCRGKISHTNRPARLREMAEDAQSCPVGKP